MDARNRRLVLFVAGLAVIGALTTAALRTSDDDEPAPGAQAGGIPTREESFDEQWEYENSTELFNAVTCSRRSGKTTGAVRRHARVLAEGDPGTWTHFGSLIRRNARKHFWNPLKSVLDNLGWGYRANNTEMILELSNGSWCQAFGCDDMAGIKAPQGDGSMLFTIDECHLPNDDVLEALVDIATPMLTDRGGMLDVLGLPPEVEGGFFSKALDGGFRVFSWTMFDHDFPRPREEKLADVIERCRRRGLAIEVITTMGADGRPRYTCGPNTHPLVARQYFGKRVTDPTKVAYEYQKGRNDYDPSTVDFETGDWRHSAGLDLGHTDCDAIVVHGWPKTQQGKCAYSRFAWKQNKLHVDDLALVVALVQRVYKPFWVGDTGGHGATKVLKTLEARMHVAFAPKPTDVMISARLMNDDYRTARLRHPTVDVETARLVAAIDGMTAWTPEQKERARKLVLEPDEPANLTGEVARVAKTINSRTRKFEINKHGLHSDISEANRYAHHGSRSWTAKPPKPEPDIHERRELAWQARKRQEEDPWR